MAPAHADGKDWFSALPDDIVLHIMTFLTTRQATLKVLSIIDTWFPWKYKTTISTPSVTIFSLWWPLSGTIVFNNMPLLVNSLLVLHVEQASSDFCQNLRSLSAAKNLTCHFYYDGKKLTIENNLQRYPKFINLVSLTLGQWCLDANFYGLIVFLRNSPILEKLNLELEKHRWGKTSQRMIGELEERSFTCEHLTSVKVKCLADDPLVNGVVNFFVKMGLNSAQVHIEHWSQPALG
ncbi:hypothetical protein DAI22_10g013700 [Oryza sativa Japonica Group]|nr:hypothetical protein DAI22_10g013700 [Oryza sativa Japonica Group]